MGNVFCLRWEFEVSFEVLVCKLKWVVYKGLKKDFCELFKVGVLIDGCYKYGKMVLYEVVRYG